MKNKIHRPVLSFLLLWVFFFTQLVFAGQTESRSLLDLPVAHQAKSGDLVDLLTFVATQFHVPVIGELAQPLPKNLNIPPGTHTARELFDLIFKKANRNTWDAAGNVAHVYDKSLLKSPKNFLNARLKSFQMPGSVGELERSLPAVLPDINGVMHEGIATTGLTDPYLSKITLPSKTVHNVTAREILFQAAQASSNFYSIIVFPNARPRTQADYDSAYGNWLWRALDSKGADKVYVQNPPSRR